MFKSNLSYCRVYNNEVIDDELAYNFFAITDKKMMNIFRISCYAIVENDRANKMILR
jgi:hypothetical protein